MIHFNLYINPGYGKFMGQSLCHYGILLQNNQYNIVYDCINPVKPYYIIDEAIILHPTLCNKIRNEPNVVVYKNGKIVLSKVTDDNDIVTFYDDVYDLSDSKDKSYVDSQFNNIDLTRKIYSTNTEPMPNLKKTENISGLASGYYLAEMAYRTLAKNVYYFDYSYDSLNFQQRLINSDDRYKLFIENIGNMTVGNRDTNMADLESLDMNNINKYYDYLRTANVTLLEIDLRKSHDINNLFNVLPENTTLWISNVLHYITTINDYSRERYELIDKLCKLKNINLLPHTRIYYEGSNNLPQ